MTNRETYGDDTVTILDMVATERGRQEFLKSQGKFTYTCADKEMTHAEASTVLQEEVGEVAHEVNEGIGPDRYIDKRRLLKELIEVAAVAVAWAERTHKEIESDIVKSFGTIEHNPEIKQYMVIANRASGAVFVKEKDFFISQGGDKQVWGKDWDWKEVGAVSIEHARELGCKMFPWAKAYEAQAKP